MNSSANSGRMWYCLTIIGTSVVVFMSCGSFYCCIPVSYLRWNVHLQMSGLPRAGNNPIVPACSNLLTQGVWSCLYVAAAGILLSSSGYVSRTVYSKSRRGHAFHMYVQQQINICHLYLLYPNWNHSGHSLNYNSLYKKKKKSCKNFGDNWIMLLSRLVQRFSYRPSNPFNVPCVNQNFLKLSSNNTAVFQGQTLNVSEVNQMPSRVQTNCLASKRRSG